MALVISQASLPSSPPGLVTRAADPVSTAVGGETDYRGFL
jgi:hypothetical protein